MRFFLPFFLLATIALSIETHAQVPEGGTAGKVDRAPLLKPLDGKPKTAETKPPMVAVPKPTEVPETTQPTAPVEPTVEAAVIDKAAKPALRRGFLIETKVVNPRVFFPIKGGEKTVLAAAYEWSYGTQNYSKEKWAEVDPGEFAADSIALADSLLETIEPRYVKDSRGVIEYAILNDDDPFISSVLISKKFIDRFEETLGDKINAIVMDRKVVYLFPATGTTLGSFADALSDQYADTPEPVSLEIFAITREGYEIIGSIE